MRNIKTSSKNLPIMSAAREWGNLNEEEWYIQRMKNWDYDRFLPDVPKTDPGRDAWAS